MDNPAQSSPSITPPPQPPATAPKNKPNAMHPAVSKTLFILFGIILIFISIAGGMYLYTTNKPSSTGKSNNPITQIQEMIQPGSTTKNNTSTTNDSASGTAASNTSPGGNTTTTNQTNSPSGSSTTQQNSQSSNNSQSQQSSQWKTYENSAEKFSIPYPVTLRIKEAAYGMGINNIEIKNPNSPPDSVPEFQLLTFPKVIGNTIGQNFEEYYDMADGSTKVLSAEGSPSQLFTKIRNRSIGSLRAFDYKTTSNPPKADEIPGVGTYIEIGNNVVVLSTSESNRATLDSMLSGFKYPL